MILDIVKSEVFFELWCECDVCWKEDLLNCFKDVDVVYNLVVVYCDDVWFVSFYYDVNVEGVWRFVEVVMELGLCWIIFMSIVVIYGLLNDELSEEVLFDFFNDYGYFKI